MIKIEHTDVYGWEAAIRGMRNPMNSWGKSDTDFGKYWSTGCDSECLTIGDNDHDLMMRLAKGGSVHAKYRRMITVTCDITAPLYWWKEFDTYKVGTVANSCSTMHKIHAKEFVLGDFSWEKINTHMGQDAYAYLIDALNNVRELFLECTVSKYATAEECKEKKKQFFDEMIQLLPSSYNQKRTIQMNYEVLVGMFRDRRNHKLDEWRTFCDWIKSLPYAELIVGDAVGE